MILDYNLPRATFPTLAEVFKDINEERANAGAAVVKTAGWSAFLSAAGANSVKKFWIDELLRGNPVAHENGLAILSAINAVRKQMQLPMLRAEDVIHEQAEGEENPK